MSIELVEKYLASIGVRRPKSWPIFVKQGRRRFGKPFEDLMLVIQDRANGVVKDDPYALKNSSLELSLYVGEYYASSMWREFASWLVRENMDRPSQVLDIGCENGVLTCFYGSLWPDAKVVGIERCSAAIASARKLAANLGLANVAFEHADARDYLGANGDRFQIIMASLVMHEMLERDGARKPFQWNGEYERIEDIALTNADVHAIQTLKAVGGALTENGFLISVDRSPTAATTWWYVQCLEEAGMKVSLSRSHMIECQGPSRGEGFALTVARRARRGESRTAAEEIVSLASFKKLAAMKMSFQEGVADVIVRSLGPTEVMFEAVCNMWMEAESVPSVS
jgi:SAM-dependent methyltransferase